MDRKRKKARDFDSEITRIEQWMRDTAYVDFDDWDYDGEELVIFEGDEVIERYTYEELQEEGVFASKKGYDEDKGMFQTEMDVLEGYLEDVRDYVDTIESMIADQRMRDTSRIDMSVLDYSGAMMNAVAIIDASLEKYAE